MFEKQIYIITGGPGFGKTELINELRNTGFYCSSEFAHDFIQAQKAIGGDILPWKNVRLFQQEILNRRIAFFESVPDGRIAFADRGIPDQLAFARYKGIPDPEILIQNAIQYRYASQVFVTPPWPDIFVNDEIRTESYEEAVRIHQSVVKTYAGLNYQIIELPLVAISQRIDFVLQNIEKRTQS